MEASARIPEADAKTHGPFCFREAKRAFDQANYSRSLQLYLRFIKMAESDGDFSEKVLEALCNIGAIHFYFSDYLGALEYFRKGYGKSMALGNVRMQEFFINNQSIGLIKLNRLNEAEQMTGKLLQIRGKFRKIVMS